jgi:hypothetical protein
MYLSMANWAVIVRYVAECAVSAQTSMNLQHTEQRPDTSNQIQQVNGLTKSYQSCSGVWTTGPWSFRHSTCTSANRGRPYWR